MDREYKKEYAEYVKWCCSRLVLSRDYEDWVPQWEFAKSHGAKGPESEWMRVDRVSHFDPERAYCQECACFTCRLHQTENCKIPHKCYEYKNCYPSAMASCYKGPLDKRWKRTGE